jgi:hypothetical protein
MNTEEILKKIRENIFNLCLYDVEFLKDSTAKVDCIVLVVKHT